jgi:hypothetical protein
MNGNSGLRIVAVLVLIAAVAAIGFFAFQAGVAQGSPVTIQSPSGGTAPLPYPYYGWGMPYARPFGFGYGLGCFGPLLGFFLLFLAFRFLFWGPRWGWRHHGPWRKDWSEAGVPPMFDQWHKRAHGENTEDKKES